MIKNQRKNAMMSMPKNNPCGHLRIVSGLETKIARRLWGYR
ncbi:hypothetical protein SAMN05216227_102441 [Pseudorhodobacter antarcticus]|uniref:Uncharacterized protein n=1 Tax=Pseudorhodobacter antarcticus TaxID=1077947 RepID=A0A1H8JBM9_9RHOB|nr:hypothetical protein SAMN05216227_102441 [Pseudorhodobacter antarcticus]